MTYVLHLITYFNIYLIVALSLNVIVGYCGLLTMAHAAFYVTGAYAYAILATNGWGFGPALLAGTVLAGGLSLLLSLASWRLRGDFFVLASLAVQALIYAMVYNWASPGAPLGSWQNLTNGSFGIGGIPRPIVFGVTVMSPLSFAILASVMAAGCAAILWRLQESPWGRLLIAMREDELALRGLGKNTRKLKVQAFGIAAAMAAVAGALYAGHVQYIDPSAGALDHSVLMLSMAIVGGLGNFRGPIIGAAFLVLLPEVLRSLSVHDATASAVRMILYGALLTLLMHLRPQGIGGQYRLS